MPLFYQKNTLSIQYTILSENNKNQQLFIDNVIIY